MLFVAVLLPDTYFGNPNLNVESVRFSDSHVSNLSLIFNGLGLSLWRGIILKRKKITKLKNTFIKIVWFNIDLTCLYNFELPWSHTYFCIFLSILCKKKKIQSLYLKNCGFKLKKPSKSLIRIDRFKHDLNRDSLID